MPAAMPCQPCVIDRGYAATSYELRSVLPQKAGKKASEILEFD
jgi:hypothetical protein